MLQITSVQGKNGGKLMNQNFNQAKAISKIHPQIPLCAALTFSKRLINVTIITLYK